MCMVEVFRSDGQGLSCYCAASDLARVAQEVHGRSWGVHQMCVYCSSCMYSPLRAQVYHDHCMLYVNPPLLVQGGRTRLSHSKLH